MTTDQPALLPLCGNPDHRRLVPAVAEVSFPSGRWHSALVCRSDLRVHLRLAESEDQTIVVTPINAVLSHLSGRSNGNERARHEAPANAIEALGECGLPLHVAEAVVHDLDLVDWEVRRQPVPEAQRLPQTTPEEQNRQMFSPATTLEETAG